MGCPPCSDAPRTRVKVEPAPLAHLWVLVTAAAALRRTDGNPDGWSDGTFGFDEQLDRPGPVPWAGVKRRWGCLIQCHPSRRHRPRCCATAVTLHQQIDFPAYTYDRLAVGGRQGPRRAAPDLHQLPDQGGGTTARGGSRLSRWPRISGCPGRPSTDASGRGTSHVNDHLSGRFRCIRWCV